MLQKFLRLFWPFSVEQFLCFYYKALKAQYNRPMLRGETGVSHGATAVGQLGAKRRSAKVKQTGRLTDSADPSRPCARIPAASRADPRFVPDRRAVTRRGTAWDSIRPQIRDAAISRDESQGFRPLEIAVSLEAGQILSRSDVSPAKSGTDFL